MCQYLSINIYEVLVKLFLLKQYLKVETDIIQ